MLTPDPGSGYVPAFPIPMATAPTWQDTLLGCVFVFAVVALVFAGLALVYVDVWRALVMQFETADSVIEQWWPVPPARRGGLALRTRPGADVVYLHNRERGEVAA